MMRIIWLALTIVIFLAAAPLPLRAQQATTKEAKDSWAQWALLLTDTFLVGVDEEDQRVVKQDLAGRAIECSVYYLVASQANFPDAEKKKILAFNESFFFLADSLISDKEIIEALWELSSKQIIEIELKNDWGRTPIIINKYGFECKKFYENPEDVIAYYMDIEGVDGSLTKKDILRILQKHEDK